jgi:two-component system NarL family response regulator
MTVPARARILLADEEMLFRTALRLALDEEDGLVVVAEAATGQEALSQLQQMRPELALLAASLPGTGVAEICAAAQAQSPRCRVLVLDDEPRHATLLSALQSGADGYLTRDSGFGHLVASTRAILRGEAYVPPIMLGGLLHDLIQRRRNDDAGLRRFERLSRRERQVLAAIAAGKDAVATAAELAISTQTARTHIQNVLSKLEVHSRVEAAAFAYEPAIYDRLLVP